jgi:hypothetical protein
MDYPQKLTADAVDKAEAVGIPIPYRITLTSQDGVAQTIYVDSAEINSDRKHIADLSYPLTVAIRPLTLTEIDALGGPDLDVMAMDFDESEEGYDLPALIPLTYQIDAAPIFISDLRPQQTPSLL